MWINPLLSRACVLASFSVCVDVPVVICYSLSYIFIVFPLANGWLELESEFGAWRSLTLSAPAELAFASYFLLV